MPIIGTPGLGPALIRRGGMVRVIVRWAHLGGAPWSAEEWEIYLDRLREPARACATQQLYGRFVAREFGQALLTLLEADSSWWLFLPGLLVAMVGIGMLNPSVSQVALSSVPPERAASPPARTTCSARPGSRSVSRRSGRSSRTAGRMSTASTTRCGWVRAWRSPRPSRRRC
jgi:hypothetical protein